MAEVVSNVSSDNARADPGRDYPGYRGKFGLPVERDPHFDADKTLSAYADEARQQGRIVT